MRWLSFDDNGTVRHGYLDGEAIAVTGDGDLSGVISGSSETVVLDRIPLHGARLLTPVLRPGKVLAAAANYQSHITEAGGKERDVRTASPRLFLKPDTSVAGPDEAIVLNPITHQLDWEVEIAVFIGRTAREVTAEAALDHVFGYATSNDISARSLDLGIERDGAAWTGFFDWLEGKWLDASAPIGPYLVTPDEISDPQDLSLTLHVNGEIKQSGTTADMVHTIAELIAFSSRLMTLNPGDVILTGTPSGVGATTGVYLKPGDVMVAEVSGLGPLTTPVAAAKSAPATA